MIGPMELESSAIRRVLYDAATAVLYVEFKSSQSVYAYAGVERPLFEALMNAGSVGQYFHHQIKKQFEHEVVSQDEWSVLLRSAAHLREKTSGKYMRAATAEWLGSISDEVAGVDF